MDVLEELTVLAGLVDNTQDTNPEAYNRIYGSIKEIKYFTHYIPVLKSAVDNGMK